MNPREILIAHGVDPDTIEAFLEWHRANPLVWFHFERVALEAIKKGKKFGAKAIGEIVRWEADFEQGEEFKLNNNYLSYYARIFAAKYPAHRDYFEFREVKGLKAA